MNREDIVAINAVITLSNHGYLTENEVAVIMSRITGASSKKNTQSKAKSKTEKTAKTKKADKPFEAVEFAMNREAEIVQLLPNGAQVDNCVFKAAKAAAQAVGAVYFKRRSTEYRLTFKSEDDAVNFVNTWSHVPADVVAKAHADYPDQRRKAQ